MQQHILTATSHTALDAIVAQITRDDADALGETYLETAARYEDAGREADATLLRLADTRWWALSA